MDIPLLHIFELNIFFSIWTMPEEVLYVPHHQKTQQSCGCKWLIPCFTTCFSCESAFHLWCLLLPQSIQDQGMTCKEGKWTPPSSCISPAGVGRFDQTIFVLYHEKEKLSHENRRLKTPGILLFTCRKFKI